MRRKYIFFWTNSTGYCSETHTFKKECIRPMVFCGSDSLLWVDGRLNMRSINALAREKALKMSGCIGYSIGYLSSHDPKEKKAQSVQKFTRIYK
ncbi:MAG: hypothetical protein WDA37_07100 [Dysgonamonadaceae bacterium]|jgi:hypothetical protein